MPNVFDKTTARVLATVLLFAAALAVLYLARKTFIVFLFAMFFAYVLEPVVARVELWVKGSRVRAIAVTYVVLLVIVAVFLLTVGPKIALEGQKLAQSVPGLIENFSSGKFIVTIGEKRGWSYETEMRIQQLITTHQGEIVAAAQSFAKRAAEVATNAPWVVLIPILAIFFLKDKGSFVSSLVETAKPGGGQTFLRRMLNDVDVMLAKYIRAQLVLAAISLVVYTAFLAIMRVPYGFALGPVAGVLEFIPVVGPAIAAVLIVGVSFLSGYQHVFALLIFVGLWRLVQDYVNAPWLLGEGLELHPLAAIFAVLVGGEVAGVVGMFLSVPVMAALRIVWRNWRIHQAAEEVVRPRAVV
ncbi:MAG: AI-2E family transporter [Acidobacteriia bacterium]|nr:AI-2E family transporter [Terriglobia bacterium]